MIQRANGSEIDDPRAPPSGWKNIEERVGDWMITAVWYRGDCLPNRRLHTEYPFVDVTIRHQLRKDNWHGAADPDGMARLIAQARAIARMLATLDDANYASNLGDTYRRNII